MEFKSILKASIFLIVGLVTITSLLSLLWNPKEVTYPFHVSGKIIPTGNAEKLYFENIEAHEQQKPKYLEVSTYSSKHGKTLPVGEGISRAPIIWKENIGEYSIPFDLQTPEILVLSWGCNYILVDFNEQKELEKDFYWEAGCPATQGTVVWEDLDEEIFHIEGIRNAFYSHMKNANLEKTDEDEVAGDYENAGDLLQESKRMRDSNHNESYENVLQASWFIFRGYKKVLVYELGYCLESANETLKKFNPLFFVPPYEITDNLNSKVRVYDTNKEVFNGGTPHSLENRIIVSNINSFENDRKKLGGHVNECEKSLKLLNETFNYQKTYYNQRWVFLLVSLISFFIAGSFVGSRLKVNERITNEFNSFISTIESYCELIFSKEGELKEEKFKFILAIIVPVITFDSFLIFQKFNSLITLSAWISVILELLALIFLLISQRYENKTVKTWTWNFGMLGLVLLIIAPLFFVFLELFLKVIFWIIYKGISILPKSPSL